MESTRDEDVISMTRVDVRSEDTSTFIHASERKEERNDVPEDHTSKLSLIEEALNETIAEEKARSREITELLNVLDIEPRSMPKHIQDTWSKVSAILRAEGLPEMDEISLKIIMEQKRRDKMKKARDERKLKTRYDELCKAHSCIMKRQNQAREGTESLQKFLETEGVKHEEEYANRIFMAIKLHDYRQTAEKLDESLNKLVKNDRYPDKILEKYETYLKLAEESNALDKSLAKYHDLPPSLSEARIKVDEKEKYLKDLESALFEKMKR